jgi:undecaprenyl diphosphate synthase
MFEAMESLALKHSTGQVKEITMDAYDKELYGGLNVKPEILIRTSNEIRLSNFMLHQSDNSQF